MCIWPNVAILKCNNLGVLDSIDYCFFFFFFFFIRVNLGERTVVKWKFRLGLCKLTGWTMWIVTNLFLSKLLDTRRCVCEIYSFAVRSIRSRIVQRIVERFWKIRRSEVISSFCEQFVDIHDLFHADLDRLNNVIGSRKRAKWNVPSLTKLLNFGNVNNVDSIFIYSFMRDYRSPRSLQEFVNFNKQQAMAVREILLIKNY